MYAVTAGKLSGIPYKAARIIGGPIKPSLIVLHDTAGRLDPGSSVKWFQDAKCKVSAHFVVERDGTVTQMVPCDRKAAHAGESSWGGKTFLNSCSIGIEIVNPGKLDDAGEAYFGQCFADAEPCRTAEHGAGRWLPYTGEQIDAVIDLCRSICAHYPDVNEIVGHWQISPGRKVDPGPLFPWDDVREAVFSSGAPVPVAEAKPPKSMATSKEGAVQVVNGTAGGGIALDGAWDAANKVIEKAAAANKAPGMWDVLAGVFGSTQVKIGVGIVLASALAWFWRAQKRWSLNI